MLDVGFKSCRIHRAFQDHWSNRRFRRKGRHQRGRIPVSVRSIIHGAFSFAYAGKGARHIRLRTRLVKIDQTARVDPPQPFAPGLALLGDILPALLARTYRLFFRVKPSFLRVL